MLDAVYAVRKLLHGVHFPSLRLLQSSTAMGDNFILANLPDLEPKVYQLRTIITDVGYTNICSVGPISESRDLSHRAKKLEPASYMTVLVVICFMNLPMERTHGSDYGW